MTFEYYFHFICSLFVCSPFFFISCHPLRNRHLNPLIPDYLCPMDPIVQQIDLYRQEIEALEIVTPQQLEAYRIKFLGTKRHR